MLFQVLLLLVVDVINEHAEDCGPLHVRCFCIKKTAGNAGGYD